MTPSPSGSLTLEGRHRGVNSPANCQLAAVRRKRLTADQRGACPAFSQVGRIQPQPGRAGSCCYSTAATPLVASPSLRQPRGCGSVGRVRFVGLKVRPHGLAAGRGAGRIFPRNRPAKPPRGMRLARGLGFPQFTNHVGQKPLHDGNKQPPVRLI